MSEPEQTVTTNRRRRWIPRLVGVLWLIALAILFSRYSAFLELANHCTMHVCWLGAGLIVLALWFGQWKTLLAAVPPTMLFFSLWQPWNLAFEEPPVDGENRLKILVWNVLCVNQNLEEIERVIESHPVDILVLIEIRPNLLEQVPRILERYPHRLAYPSWGGNGIAMFSHRQDVQFERVDFQGRIMPSIVATLRDDDGGEALKIIGMHTWSPVPPQRARLRDHQLAQLSAWSKMQSVPLAVVGDLNITPWAPAFQELLTQGFIDSRLSGFGNAASWPAWLGPVGIPIDHALSFGRCHFANRQLGPMVWGSDHRPLLLEVNW